VRQLEIKVLDIVDARCNHEVYLLFYSYFNESCIFWAYVLKILKCQISLKSVQWEPSCYIRTEGQICRRTVVTNLIVAF